MAANIARFLRNIPQSNQPAQHLHDLTSGEHAEVCLGVALILQTLGAVHIDEQQAIRASSQTAKYLLYSLASYIESGTQIVTDWHTRGVYPDGTNNPLQNAATLLHTLETRRFDLLDNPPPARTEHVAQVLIKRSNPRTGRAELLFQFDGNANQYQLIGGRHSDNDDSVLTTMIREIEEELATDLVYERDYHLTCVAENLTPPATISSTFGALTEYHFWVYHMADLKQPLHLQPGDMWVPVAHVLAGYALDADGNQLPFNSSDIYHLMNDAIPGGLESLPDSLTI